MDLAAVQAGIRAFSRQCRARYPDLKDPWLHRSDDGSRLWLTDGPNGPTLMEGQVNAGPNVDTVAIVADYDPDRQGPDRAALLDLPDVSVVVARMDHPGGQMVVGIEVAHPTRFILLTPADARVVATALLTSADECEEAPHA